MISDSHSFGLESGLTSEVGALTEAVVKALGRRKSSTGVGDCVGGGGVRRGWGGRAMWLFLRWSGVDGTEEGGEDAARVGEDVSEPAGMFSGSNSRSGMGGEIRGRRVIRNKARRSNALNRKLEHGARVSSSRNALQDLKRDDAPPARPMRHLPTQPHLEK